MEEKAKLISDLYKQKSDILRALSDLNNPDYYFVIGYGMRHGWIGGSTIGFSNFEEGFIPKVKQMTVEQYNRTLEKIESELTGLLNCN